MSTRSFGIYPGPNGEILITFETGTKGVPLANLIPIEDRGEAFDDFRLSDYLGLAELVLANPADWERVGQAEVLKKATAAEPAKISIPPDIDYLNLRRSDGAMDSQRTAELFEVVQAYWTAEPNTIALEPGLVAALWRNGITAAAILRSLKQFTGTDGKLIPATGRGPEILLTVIDVYREIKGLPHSSILPISEVETVVANWVAATRSVSTPSREAGNEVLHWADYRRLGLADDAGRADLDRVRRVARRVWSDGLSPSFDDLVSYVDSLKPLSKAGTISKGAQATLRKKRKQAKLNRKRGRK